MTAPVSCDARVRAVSNRSMSLVSAAGALALLPLVATLQPKSAHNHAAPITIHVGVVTATQPLNLSELSEADFGDADSAR
jgi:hypothetical protein